MPNRKLIIAASRIALPIGMIAVGCQGETSNPTAQPPVGITPPVVAGMPSTSDLPAGDTVEVMAPGAPANVVVDGAISPASAQPQTAQPQTGLPSVTHPVLGTCEADFQPGKVPSQLLSRSQLARTLGALFDRSDFNEASLPADTSTGGFVTAESQVTSESYVTQLQASIEQLANSADGMNDSTLQACTDVAQQDQASCAQPWLASKLRQGFRRPATDEDLQSYGEFFSSQVERWGLEVGVSQVLQAIAADPRLLYRLELTTGVADANGLVAIDDHSLASRLSYFITGGPPDAALSALADSKALTTEPGRVAEEARRLIGSSAGGGVFDRFLRTWTGIKFSTISKSDALRAGKSQEELIEAWDKSLSSLISRVLEDGSGTIQELLTTPDLSLPDEIADVYGDLGPRAGLLTHPGLLAQFAHETTSPVLRGVFVRDHLLCSPAPPPPPGIDLKLPEAEGTNTTREQYAQIEEQGACAGCHNLIHSIGFAFEEYDSLGRYRTEENGFPVDASGQFVGFSDPALTGNFTGVQELATAIADSEQLRSCLARGLYESAIGRELDSLDRCELQRLSAEFTDSAGMNGQLHELAVAIAGSARFGKTVLATQGGQ